MNRIWTFLLALALFSCSSPSGDAVSIINQSIESAGGDRYENAMISFDFRDLHYNITRNGGQYLMERTRVDEQDTIHDFLDNDGFSREINSMLVDVPDSMVPRYSNSINSVFYFALLPFGLNDAAVNKEYLGSITLKGQDYHKIKVTFNQEGGGEDFDDVFIYWINKQTWSVDYLAYEYHTDGGGLRFREALNPRVVGGIRFVDYNNYKPKEKGSVPLRTVDEAFLKDQLKLLSKIELENVDVTLQVSES